MIIHHLFFSANLLKYGLICPAGYMKKKLLSAIPRKTLHQILYILAMKLIAKQKTGSN